MEVLEFGHRLLIVAAVLTGLTGLFSIGSLMLHDRRWVIAARNGFYVLFGVLLCSAGCLVYGFVTGQYNNEYIYNYSERQLPTFYKIAGLWAGLDGSLLFWTLVLSAFAAGAALQHRWSARHPTGRRMEPYVYLALSVVLGFFVAISLSENVFSTMEMEKRLRLAQVHRVGIDAHGNLLDGHGLNPQLVNYWFVIHPPTLYVGFIGFTIPFVFTIAALAVGEIGDYWIRIARRWTMVTWVFLTSGIILGGLWAYRQLGWGGYWAWDPVENASFLPWLTGTAFMHSIMIQERRDMLKGWNVFLICLTFFLTIVGTWMTRSGVVESVHAFAGGSVAIWFQIFMLGLAGGSMFLICFRRRALSGRHNIESLLSREVAFYVNNLVLVIIALIVFFLSFLPKLSHDWLAVSLANKGWFEIATTPFFVLLLFLTAVGPGLGWVKTSARALRRNFLGSGLFSLFCTVLVYTFFYFSGLLGTWREVLLPRFFHLEGLSLWSLDDLSENARDLFLWQHNTALYPTGILIFLCTLICATIGTELLRAVLARVRLRKQSFVEATVTTVVRNNRRWGGYVVHIGIAILTVGIIGSGMFNEKLETHLNLGESARIGDFRIELVDTNLRQEPIEGEPYWKGETIFRVTRESSGFPEAHGQEKGEGGSSGVHITELRPEARYYPKQGQWINEVSIHRTLVRDIYVYGRRDTDAFGNVGNGFSLVIYLNPLMMLIYLGWFTMIGGAIFAALPVSGSKVGLSE